jgi:hypothetical protein
MPSLWMLFGKIPTAYLEIGPDCIAFNVAMMLLTSVKPATSYSLPLKITKPF